MPFIRTELLTFQPYEMKKKPAFHYQSRSEISIVSTRSNTMENARFEDDVVVLKSPNNLSVASTKKLTLGIY